MWCGAGISGGRPAPSPSTLATSQADPNLPAVECPVGAIVSLWGDDGAPLFQGEVVSRELDDSAAVVPVTAHDRGMFLANNDGTAKIRDERPEDAVQRLCRTYGIPVGSLAATGVPVRRKFSAVPLWSIVSTLYTLAAQRTGKTGVWPGLSGTSWWSLSAASRRRTW